MDFESPDVEREFPGLYASESGKRSQESDFSDEAHERPSKKDLLIGKRKEKKESKKDQGYAALEGESSAEEDVDVKSPSKSKKSKSFKFPTIKEKREKSREKDVKEKDREKEKETEKEKDKKKESKSKLKLKDKKKSKHIDDGSENIDDMPVFGIPLSVAVERNHCHDGILIPVIVRDCIDHIQEFGLCVEGIYKVSGVKSKVQQLKRSYNRREHVNLNDFDLFTTTSLLKTFIRELPEPILTTESASKFEETVTIKEPHIREETLNSLIAQLPPCNQTCLAWIMRHLDSVSAHERQNKMGVNALSITLSPILQMSTRLTSALLCHSRALFPHVKLIRYIPPLSTSCTMLPNSSETIAAELAKQESLLGQIHSEMNHGYTVRAEQLWEVQRFITQLKRKLKSLEKAQESSQLPQEELPSNPGASATMQTSVALPSASSDVKSDTVVISAGERILKSHNTSDTEDTNNLNVGKFVSSKVIDEVDKASDISEKTSFHIDPEFPEQKFQTEFPEEKFQPEFPEQKFQPEFPEQKFQPEFPEQKFQPEFPEQKFQPEFPEQKFQPEFTEQKFQPEFPEQKFQPEFPQQKFQLDFPEQKFQPEFPDQKFQLGPEDKASLIFLEYEQRELLQLVSDLKSRILHERDAVEALQSEVSLLKSHIGGNSSSIVCQVISDGNMMENKLDSKKASDLEYKEKDKLFQRITQLMNDRSCLIQQIMHERQLCIQLRAELELMQVRDIKQLNVSSTLVSDVK